MSSECAARAWATKEFGAAELGDRRRTLRLVNMATAVSLRPKGTVTGVFRSSATRQGAYDLLSNDAVTPSSILDAMAQATTERTAGHGYCFVAIDGTSLSLADWQRRKDFGAIGRTSHGARGLKVINSLALSPEGVPLGLLDQQWWQRKAHKRRRDCQRRLVGEKETRFWLGGIQESLRRLENVHTPAWFLIDREGDRYQTLKKLAETGQRFTVRSTYGTRFVFQSGKRMRLSQAVRRGSRRFQYSLQIPGRFNRRRRVARLLVRSARVTLDMVEAPTKERYPLEVNVVDVREYAATARNDEPIHWRLFTNAPIRNRSQVQHVITGYTHRWKIEEFHRTWKSGACCVEDTQLRSSAKVIRWAMILAATAARIERLKGLARTHSDVAASAEFSRHELMAIAIMRRHFACSDTDRIETRLSVATLVERIAELGGYTGEHSGGPPGSTTIRRGLDLIAPVAAALQQIESDELCDE